MAAFWTSEGLQRVDFGVSFPRAQSLLDGRGERGADSRFGRAAVVPVLSRRCGEGVAEPSRRISLT